MAKDALDAHARDELGFSEARKTEADPGRLGLGGFAFSVGAALPTLAAFLSPRRRRRHRRVPPPH